MFDAYLWRRFVASRAPSQTQWARDLTARAKRPISQQRLNRWMQGGAASEPSQRNIVAAIGDQWDDVVSEIDQEDETPETREWINVLRAQLATGFHVRGGEVDWPPPPGGPAAPPSTPRPRPATAIVPAATQLPASTDVPLPRHDEFPGRAVVTSVGDQPLDQKDLEDILRVTASRAARHGEDAGCRAGLGLLRVLTSRERR